MRFFDKVPVVNNIEENELIIKENFKSLYQQVDKPYSLICVGFVYFYLCPVSI